MTNGTNAAALRRLLTGSLSGAVAFTLGLGCAYGTPYEPEACSNALDDSGDGQVDCADGECAATELCAGDCQDGLDNDGDGTFDCGDPSCAPSEPCRGGCADQTDNDQDGTTDCDDQDCAGDDACAGG